MTLYFSAKSKEGLGGYDIYVTRFNTDSAKFYHPENIGLPYNSKANDYYCVIDEFDNIGWLVTDRRQPKGKVCIYTFVPAETRTTYDGEVIGEDTLKALAEITRISDTWTDKAKLQSARRRLASLLTRNDAVKAKTFSFIVNDKTVYTSLSDFKSPKSRERLAKLQQMEKAAKGHPKAEAALKQAKQAKAKVESAGEMLKEVKDTMAKQGAKAQKATKKAVGKTKSALDKAVKTAQKFKDTVDTPANRAKVKDAAYSIGSSLKEAVGDVIKEVSKARTASKAKTGKSKAQTEKAAPKATKSAKAKTGTARTATKSAAAKPAAGKKKVAAEKSADKPAASQSAKGGRADEDVTEFTAKELGLSTEEYGQIGQLLGHIPSFTELSLYARMWADYNKAVQWKITSEQ